LLNAPLEITSENESGCAAGEGGESLELSEREGRGARGMAEGWLWPMSGGIGGEGLAGQG
jgi:hypothetical protein